MKMCVRGEERYTLRNQKFGGANIKLSPGWEETGRGFQERWRYISSSLTQSLVLHHVSACLYTHRIAMGSPSYWNMKCYYR